MKIVIRADASTELGTGHVMRCLTLAAHLRDHAEIMFICRELPESLGRRLAQENVQVRLIKGRAWAPGQDLNWKEDADQSLGALNSKDADWVIVDHYGLDNRWESILKSRTQHLMVIDDMADRKHDCDILLDQNLTRDAEIRYQTLIPKTARQLLGPQYALLRPEFSAVRNKDARRRELPIKRLAISFGGADHVNAAEFTLKALKEWNRPAVQIDLFMGAASPHIKELEKRCAEMPQVHLYSQPSHFAELLSRADVAIGASGSSQWERCCLGLPSVLIALAKNQEMIGEECDASGVAVYLGPFEQLHASMIHKALQNLEVGTRMADLSLNCAAIVDGQGASRVAETMLSLSRRPIA